MHKREIFPTQKQEKIVIPKFSITVYEYRINHNFPTLNTPEFCHMIEFVFGLLLIFKLYILWEGESGA